MKRGKFAQSEIITTVLIILLILAAIVIVWNVVKKTVVTGTEGIETSKLIINLEIKEVKLWVTGGAEVKVRRGAGEGKIENLEFIFEESDGGTEIINVKEGNPNCEIPNELETRVCNFNASEINEKIEKVSVAPMFGSSTGIQVYENEKEIEKDESGERIPEENLPQEIINDLKFVSWWKFDGNTNDSIRGNNGSLMGDSYVNADGELVLDGNNDYVQIPANPSLAFGTGNFSLSVWINTKNITGLHRILFTDDLYLMSDVNKIRFGLTNPSTSSLNVLSTKTLSKEAWYHVVVVRDRKNNLLRLYLDGEQNNTAADNVSKTVSNLNLYISRPGGLESWNGTIDNVMIFNKTLSNAEIQAIYNNQKK